IEPWRIGGSPLDQCAPRRGGLRAIAVLLGCKPEKVARLHSVRIECDRPFERSLSLRRHDPIGGEYQRLAERSLALRRRAIEPKCIAPRPHRVIETPEPDIDRRDHLPAASVVRIALKMGLHRCNQSIDRLIGAGSGKTRGERPVGKERRSGARTKWWCGR